MSRWQDRSDFSDDTPSDGPMPIRPSELRVLQAAENLAGTRVLCTSLGRGQAAAEIAQRRSEASVVCWFLDQYQQRLAAAAQANRENLSIVCSADFPEQPFDLALVPLSFRGEAELARDLIQDAFSRLVIGGHLVTAVDHPRDRWLHDQLREMFPKVTVIASEDAVCYVTTKRAPQRRPRVLVCEFTFRDGPRLLRAVTRPGVFSHRRLDPGARQLIDAVPPWVPDSGSAVEPPRIIDIGCGCGAVGIAIAARQPDPAGVHVLSLDSNARAVACTAQSARLCGIDSLVAKLESEGGCDQPRSYDIAVANPPYYADFRIARLFVDAAAAALRSGGRFYLVTKHPTWYQENLAAPWRDVTIRASGTYHVVSARRG